MTEKGIKFGLKLDYSLRNEFVVFAKYSRGQR